VAETLVRQLAQGEDLDLDARQEFLGGDFELLRPRVDHHARLGALARVDHRVGADARVTITLDYMSRRIPANRLDDQLAHLLLGHLQVRILSPATER